LARLYASEIQGQSYILSPCKSFRILIFQNTIHCNPLQTVQTQKSYEDPLTTGFPTPVAPTPLVAKKRSKPIEGEVWRSEIFPGSGIFHGWRGFGRFPVGAKKTAQGFCLCRGLRSPLLLGDQRFGVWWKGWCRRLDQPPDCVLALDGVDVGFCNGHGGGLGCHCAGCRRLAHPGVGVAGQGG